MKALLEQLRAQSNQKYFVIRPTFCAWDETTMSYSGTSVFILWNRKLLLAETNSREKGQATIKRVDRLGSDALAAFQRLSRIRRPFSSIGWIAQERKLGSEQLSLRSAEGLPIRFQEMLQEAAATGKSNWKFGLSTFLSLGETVSETDLNWNGLLSWRGSEENQFGHGAYKHHWYVQRHGEGEYHFGKFMTETVRDSQAAPHAVAHRHFIWSSEVRRAAGYYLCPWLMSRIP